MRRITGNIIIAVMAAICLAVPVPARGDVAVERLIRFSWNKSMGGSSTVRVEKISGLKRSTRDTAEMTGPLKAMMKSFSGPAETDTTVVITRLDSGLSWRIKPAHRFYTKLFLGGEEDISGEDDAHDGYAEGNEEEEEFPGEDDYSRKRAKMVRSDFVSQDTQVSRDVNGFNCTKHTATWFFEAEDEESGERTVLTMDAEIWLTPDNRETKALAGEEAAFNRAFREKTGISPWEREMKLYGLVSLAGYLNLDERQLEEAGNFLREKLDDLEGYPIAVSLKWVRVLEVDGPSKEGRLPEEEKELFQSYVEVRRIDLAAIPAEEFEVPAGYRLDE